VPFFAYPGLMGATGRGESSYKNYTNDARIAIYSRRQEEEGRRQEADVIRARVSAIDLVRRHLGCCYKQEQKPHRENAAVDR